MVECHVVDSAVDENGEIVVYVDKPKRSRAKKSKLSNETNLLANIPTKKNTEVDESVVGAKCGRSGKRKSKASSEAGNLAYMPTKKKKMEVDGSVLGFYGKSGKRK